jgi:leader peptidase (prepilin peptidase)/N-methyltransferase
VPPWGWGAIGLVLGAIAGSYLATLVLRWPRGGRTRAGRSRCDSCAHALAPADLVPLLSYALRRGRCRYCSAPIDPRHPLIEALAAAIGLIAFIAVPGPQGLLAAAFGWLLLALAMLDFDHLWLPDRLTVPLALAGLGAGLAGFAPPLAERLLGGGVGYGTLALIAWLYRRLRGREGLGAGDAKLLGAIGLWTGWPVLPFILLGASVVGLAGVLACRLAGRRIDAATPLPFGTCLAVAAWPVWLFAVLR